MGNINNHGGDSDIAKLMTRKIEKQSSFWFFEKKPSAHCLPWISHLITFNYSLTLVRYDPRQKNSTNQKFKILISLKIYKPPCGMHACSSWNLALWFLHPEEIIYYKLRSHNFISVAMFAHSLMDVDKVGQCYIFSYKKCLKNWYWYIIFNIKFTQ